MALVTDGTVPLGSLTIGDLRGNRRRQRKEKTVRGTFFGMALLSLVISAAIVLSLVGEAWTFISQVDISSLWADGWFPRSGDYGLATIVVGTLIVTGVAMLIAAPVGLASAIYLSEYASPRVRKVLKPTLEILAGVPSVVIGFFALKFIAPELLQKIFSGSPQSTLASAGLGVGLLTIPL